LQAVVRTAAREALLDWAAGAAPAIPLPSADLTVRMLAASMGDDVPLEYGPMLREELEKALGMSVPDPLPSAPD
jgi:4-hydroxyacetophenone monooxygenase